MSRGASLHIILVRATFIADGETWCCSSPPISCRLAPTANQTNPDRAGFLTSIQAPAALSR
jgi:hypothetical protein